MVNIYKKTITDGIAGIWPNDLLHMTYRQVHDAIPTWALTLLFCSYDLDLDLMTLI